MPFEARTLVEVFHADRSGWAPPPWAVAVTFRCIGGAAGGGAGISLTSGNTRIGGPGGGPGGYAEATYAVVDLPPSTDIRVGVGGDGGTAVPGSGGDWLGAPGAGGSASYIGDSSSPLCYAGGGSGGGSYDDGSFFPTFGISKVGGFGGTGTVDSGSGAPSSDFLSPDGLSPTVPSDAVLALFLAGFILPDAFGGGRGVMTAGGGSGGGIQTDDIEHPGGDGGVPVVLGTFTPPAGGVPSGGNGAAGASVVGPNGAIGGTGGGGGASSTTQPGGNGGDGGLGAGGGGGGATQDGTPMPGAGGRGGDGLVVIESRG